MPELLLGKGKASGLGGQDVQHQPQALTLSHQHRILSNAGARPECFGSHNTLRVQGGCAADVAVLLACCACCACCVLCSVLCRDEAQKLWAERAALEAAGLKVVCVVHEWIDREVSGVTEALLSQLLGVITAHC